MDQKCRLNPSLTAEEVKCLALSARKGEALPAEEVYGYSRTICEYPYKTCTDRLQKASKGTDVKIIASACKEDDEETQECVLKDLGSHFFNKKGSSSSFDREAQDVASVCNIKNATARECVKRTFTEGLSLKDAKLICNHGHEKTRQCLKEVALKKGPLVGLPEDFVNEYCMLTDDDDRACFIGAFKESPDLAYVRSRCHNFTAACYQNFLKVLPYQLHYKIDMEFVCADTNG